MADPKPDTKIEDLAPRHSVGLRLEEGPIWRELTLGGTTFRHRILCHGDVQELREEHTKGGVLDSRAFSAGEWALIFALPPGVLGWEDLYVGPEGSEEPLPFSPDQVPRVVRLLPDSIANAIRGSARAPLVKLHKALGNSEGS